MTRVHQVASLIIIVFSVWVMYMAHQYTYWTALGPGPGFFPFWLGVFMAVLSAIWFVQLMMKPLEGKAIEFLPSRAGIVRILAIIISVFLVGLFMEDVGFSVIMFVFMLFLLIGLGRVNPVVTLVIALTCSFGLYWLFTNYLDVPFPESSIGFLKNLGF